MFTGGDQDSWLAFIKKIVWVLRIQADGFYLGIYLPGNVEKDQSQHTGFQDGVFTFHELKIVNIRKIFAMTNLVQAITSHQ